MYEYKLSAACAAVALLVATSGTAIAIDVGNVNQTTNNDVPISNIGTIMGGSVSGDGASVSVSASGAQSAVSETFVNTITDLTIGNVNQTTTNTSAVVDGQINPANNDPSVINTGEITVNNVSGHGASVSLSASGATSAVSGIFVGSITDLEIGNVTQTTRQIVEAEPPALPTISNNPSDFAGIFVNNVSGDGASVQSSAIAAASQVSASFINGGGSVDIGNITQITRSDPIRRILNDAGIGAVDDNGFRVSGDGASVSVSATGAASTVSVVGIGKKSGTSLDTVEIGNIRQTTTHDFQKVHTVSAPIQGFGNDGLKQVSGAGASAAISVTGAQSSVAVVRISGVSDDTLTDIGNITQTTRVTDQTQIEGSGNFPGVLSGGITGDGASVSATTTGAISSVSVGSINSNGSTRVIIGNITQTTTTAEGHVTNDAFLDGSDSGNVSGDGASASLSATGAVSVVSLSSINSAVPRPNSDVGNINQRTINNAVVMNEVGGQDVPNTVTLGNISGHGASASLSASGATSAVGFTSIGNKGAGNPSINVGNITQRTINNADVTNKGATSAAVLDVGNISGNGASASVSASGAVSQVSVASINDAEVTTTNISPFNVNQTTINNATVANTGIINYGNISGNGASMSVGAVGAASVLSISVIH